jgi:hypothetical protein
MPAAPYKATQMKPISPTGVRNTGEYCADKLEITAPSVPVAKGNDGKASMVDGPYGGRKPA